MMVRCDESSKPNYSNIFSISSASETFNILPFSTFISFSLLGIFHINLNCIINLSTALYRQLDLRMYTRISCLPKFFLLCFLFMDRSLFSDSLFRLFSGGTRDWRVCPSSTLQVVWLVSLFSRTSQLSLYCQHTNSQVMKSLYHLYRKIALVFFYCWTSDLVLCISLLTMGLSYAVRF